MNDAMVVLDKELHAYFSVLVNKTQDELPDIQHLLDAYRKVYDVDVVYILENDIENGSFVYTIESLSASEYTIKGQRVPIAPEQYKKFRAIYDSENICEVNVGSYMAGRLKSIMHYAAIYNDEITGCVGMLDMHRERKWTGEERRYLSKLGRALSNYIIRERLTRLNRAYEEVSENAKKASEAKSRFLFNMSHDIRTPMNAVIGYTQMTRRSVTDPEKALGYLDKIESAGQELLALINQVLEMSRIESGRLVLAERPVSIRKEAAATFDVMAITAEAASVKFESKIKHLVNDRVLVDADSINQILLNVMSNAIKYSKTGGRVLFTVDEQPTDDSKVSRYVFTVKDEGIGMSAEFLEHIFDEFSRENHTTVSKIQGTGLGMSIVKRLVDLHGGTIDIESQLGKGTTVTIAIPMKISAEDADAVSASPAENVFTEANTLRGRRVLLVEDNEMNLEIAEEILKEKGLLVETARDGDIAVEMVREVVSRQAYLYYDFILMDIQMPRMNGYEATREIRAIPAPPQYHLPIIAMTANAFEEDRKAAFAAGMDDHIAKPIDINVLLRTLARFVK